MSDTHEPALGTTPRERCGAARIRKHEQEVFSPRVWTEPVTLADAIALRDDTQRRMVAAKGASDALRALLQSPELRDTTGQPMDATATGHCKRDAAQRRARMLAETRVLALDIERLRVLIARFRLAHAAPRKERQGLVRRLLALLDRLEEEGARFTDEDRALLDQAAEYEGSYARTAER